MRILKSLALALVLLGGALPLWAEGFDPGIDYTVLPQPIPTDAPEGKVEVAEFFWYGCPHCYHFEPKIRAWLERKPEAAHFVRIPASLNPSWRPHAEAFYAAEALGVTDRLHTPLFDAIHEQRRRIFNRDQLARFAASQGIDEQKFRDAMDSFLVQSKVRRADDLARRAGIRGVPSVVVAGRYLVTGQQAGSYDRMIEIIDHLVRQEAARGKSGG